MLDVRNLSINNLLSKHNTTTSPTVTYLVHYIRHNSNILESAPLLEYLALDTTYLCDMRFRTTGRCPASMKNSRCSPICKTDILECQRAVGVADRYNTLRVPPTIEFKVLELCSRCHDANLHKWNK